jgi:hypothetical protein
LKPAQPVTVMSQPLKQGFAWSPEPPSPRTQGTANQRSFSPAPGLAMTKGVGSSGSLPMVSSQSGGSLPRWPM